jgi:truncated hemoglobin YjbI
VRRAGAEPTLFEWAGGLPALTRTTRLLYERHVPADDLLAPVFATMAPDLPQREAAAFAAAFGGPPPGEPAGDPADYRATGRPALTEEQRARWVALALRAADETMLPADPQFRGALTSFLEWTSRVTDTPPPAWDWGPAGPPEETPEQTTVLAPTGVDDQEAIPLPGPDETVSFEANIKPLFREHDRESMTWAFDLWSHDDVQAHAADILQQLSSGTMPCDGAWPADRVAVFKRWTESGFRP